MATPNIVPRADSEGGLGTASKYWASAYIDTITTTGNIKLPDNAYLLLGTSNDIEIAHVSDNSYLINNTGALFIEQGHDNSDIIFKGKDGGSSITALTLDMSEAGFATFNTNVQIGTRGTGVSALTLNTAYGDGILFDFYCRS